ncbi:ABC transporter ATP-binding protein [Bradyrhizobium elkanii]|uniref:ABC transporter ATP-binding protein n=1 Tax=Bradyrhizobium elkanii TaxID=29448 RepID=UPI0004B20BDB|nr:ABC transporter ATP-binding protein [Bradyrhizobium elkanii]
MENDGTSDQEVYELETVDLSKSFFGIKAVNGVSLQIKRGSTHALIGPNGAGKTTCFNLLTKFLSPTTGTIRFRGENITDWSPSQVVNLGLVRSFQISAVFPHLTALENVRLAAQRRRGRSFDFWRSERVLKDLDETACNLLEDVNLLDVRHTLAANLPYGRKRALEIATTLAVEPRMMLLDEPTAGMSHDGVNEIVALIRKIRRDKTILIVEHNLSVVEGLCDAITVLARGKVIAQGDYSTVSQDPEVIEAYLGAPERSVSFGQHQEENA